MPSGGGVAPADDHAEGDAFPAVRLLATGEEPAQVSIGIVTESGGGGSTVDVTLEPGLVTDVPLGELDAGEYTIRLDGDGPFIAAARATTGVPEEQTDPDGADPEASVDLAWTTATMPLIDTAVVAVPSGPSPVLHLANPGAEEVEARYHRPTAKSARSRSRPATRHPSTSTRSRSSSSPASPACTRP